MKIVKNVYCDECNLEKDIVIETDYEYEGNELVCWICKNCLEKALTLINKEIENE